MKTFLYKTFVQPRLLREASKKKIRFLEIGPGNNRIPDYETVNAVKSKVTDYICDCSKEPLPFDNDSFDSIYSSHFLEHIEWFKVNDILAEMFRCIKPGGFVEIWVPDGLKVAQTIVDTESGKLTQSPDGWTHKTNPENNLYIWSNARMFWGANPTYPSNHKSFYTFKFLKELLEKTGFTNIQELDLTEAKNTHGWINLGVRAYK